ncbi:hypothetical protein BGP_4013 [Beggiatoa sp. PS]|nr:hypothetical protein BGP_4013 [Beggiatoa sp. PS]
MRGTHPTLANLSSSLPPNIAKYAKNIEKFAVKLLNSHSGRNRSNAYLLWIHLLRSRLVEPPTKLEALYTRIKKEDNEFARGWIVVLIGYSTMQGFYSVEKVYELLLPLYKEQNNENLRNRTFFALALALFNPTKPSLFAFKLLNIATTGEDLRHFGHIIQYFISIEAKMQALELFKKLSIKVTESNIGTMARRNFANKLRKPISLLFRSISLEEQEQLLETIPQLDRFVGRLFVEVACSTSFDKLRDKLKILMEHPKVVEEVKELIRRHEYMRGRTSGGEGWPELYEYLLNFS